MKFLIQFYIFGILVIFAVIILSESTSLYNDRDQLWQLNSSNFKNIVYGKNSAWIIQFYNSWCGHCIRFSPIWKIFAVDTRMWRKVIDVGAVNCNDPENVKLCRDYDVQSYPTIKLFWHHLNESNMGEELSGSRDIPSIQATMINFLESNWDKGVPQNWPNLSPLEATSINQIVKSIPLNEDSIYLFVEDDNSYLGRKVILDLSFQTSVTTRRVLNTSTELLNELGPEIYNGSTPIFVKITQTGEKENIFRFEEGANSTYIRNQIFDYIVGHNRHTDFNLYDSNDATYLQNTMAGSVYMVDLENAVYYSLSQEIGVTKNIDGEKFSVLKSYLFVLKSYFPGSAPVMGYLSKLYNWISYKRRYSSGEDFVKAMDQLQSDKEYLPKMREWIGCKGSQERYRGYPCSLWTLFHILTVQANSEFTESHGYSENAGQVIFIIRDYIKNFFTCHECVENFLKMAVNLEQKVNSSQNAVVWLWEAHNEANERLAGDLTEDPMHPKIQFPSPNHCPSCRISGTTFNDTVWNKPVVLQYLNTFYGKRNIQYNDHEKIQDSSNQQLTNSSMGFEITLIPVLAPLLMLLIYSKLFVKS